jgi:hypothetical protein
VAGTYYGIALSGAHDCQIIDNDLARNMRNISVQNGCTGNVVRRNRCIDSISSAIHLAYGSCGNRIAGNWISTRRARGEGLLQAYVGATDNEFSENRIRVEAPAQPKYHAYCAVHADRNRFIGNEFAGPCARAYLAIESAFSSRSNDPRHRNYRLPADGDNFATRGTSSVLLEANRIIPTSRATAIYLAQISDRRGTYPLMDCVIVGNAVLSAEPDQYLSFVEQSPGSLSRVILEGNVFPSPRPSGKFQLPRGRNHFRFATEDVQNCLP